MDAAAKAKIEERREERCQKREIEIERIEREEDQIYIFIMILLSALVLSTATATAKAAEASAAATSSSAAVIAVASDPTNYYGASYLSKEKTKMRYLRRRGGGSYLIAAHTEDNNINQYNEYDDYDKNDCRGRTTVSGVTQSDHGTGRIR